MTDEEKMRVWDGVLRRASDYPDGKSPFADKPSNWDGTLRRVSDFNSDSTSDSHQSDKDIKVEEK